MTEATEERRLVYVPSSGGTNQAGNNIFTRMKNAANKAKGSYWNKSDKGYVVEYELVPTGRRFNSKGELLDE